MVQALFTVFFISNGFVKNRTINGFDTSGSDANGRVRAMAICVACMSAEPVVANAS